MHLRKGQSSRCKLGRNIAFHSGSGGWSALEKVLAGIVVFAIAGSTATTITVAVTSSDNNNDGDGDDTYALTREICVTPECTTAGQPGANSSSNAFILSFSLVKRGELMSPRTRSRT